MKSRDYLYQIEAAPIVVLFYQKGDFNNDSPNLYSTEENFTCSGTSFLKE